MKLLPLVTGALTIALLTAACGGSSEPGATPEPSTAAEATATPTNEPGVASGPVASGQLLRSSDGRLEVSGTGRGVLDVSIREAKSPPRAPLGWQLVSPVYDITAREPGRTALVTQLKEPFELRFTSAERLATVMYYDGDSWEMVRSDVAGGVVETQVDHLTPYAIARPSNAAPASATPSATRAATTATTQPATSPPAGSTTAPAATRTPIPTVSPETAKSALEAAVSKYKGKATKVLGASGYSGGGSMSVPAQVSLALAEADAYGEMYYGLYNGVNEAFTVTAATGAGAGSFTLLVEPKAEFPATSTRAQELLAGYFPGAAGLPYTAIQTGPAAYTYQASNGSAFFVLGFTQEDGVPLAFLSTGSGVFTATAVSVK